MPVKKYKPTSPGRRQMATSSFDEITRSTPEKSLLEPLRNTGGPHANGPHTTRPPDRRPQRERAHHDPSAGRRAQAPLPAARLQAVEGRRPREGRFDRVRPEPL